MKFDLDFGLREPDIEISKSEVSSCTDSDFLHRLYRQLDDANLEMTEFIAAFRDAEIDDEDWFKRIAGRLAYCRIAIRWIERRLLTLGETPDYSPTDPRARQLRIMDDRVNKLNTEIKRLQETQQKAAA